VIVTAIDLAARFSAFCTLGPGRQLLGYGAPLMDVHVDWLADLINDFVIRCFENQHEEQLLLVEDVPLSLPFTAKVKAPIQLQGEIAYQLRSHNLQDRLFFIQPMTWQRHFEGVWKGKEAGALAAAVRLGFEPPDYFKKHEDLFADLKGKERQTVRLALKKQSADVVDAFLMAVWAQETYETHGTLEVKNVIRYLGQWN